jgi:hypothetical protein
MPSTTTRKLKNTRQVIASLLVDADLPEGQTAFVIKTPRAGLKHREVNDCACYSCYPARDGGLKMYGVEFTDGVGLVTEREAKDQIIRVKINDDEAEERPMTARELAERIVAEYPDYTLEELA